MVSSEFGNKLILFANDAAMLLLTRRRDRRLLSSYPIGYALAAAFPSHQEAHNLTENEKGEQE
jgi:hypothetical protein